MVKISWENPLKENGYEFLGSDTKFTVGFRMTVRMTVRRPSTGRLQDPGPLPFVKSGDCHGRFFGRATTEAWPITSSFVTTGCYQGNT